MVVATYAGELVETVLSIETINSYLKEVVFEKTKKKIKNMGQIFPTTFSKAVDRVVKEKNTLEEAQSMQAQRGISGLSVDTLF